VEDAQVSRAHAFLILLISGAIGAVGEAQSRTSDAVSAMLRGDYARAAEILEPIVQDWRQRDPAAAFFMATLYDTGRGGVQDPMRACALYQQAFSDEQSVYAPTAQLLQRRLWTARGNEWFAECQLVANIGIDHRFQPETFALGVGHSVDWTLSAATVAYDNRTKRVPLPMAGARGTRFLPLYHTELRTPASADPLHFFEMFWWEPSAEKWTLHAHLFEVYRDEVVTVEADAVSTATTAEPPSLTRAELQTLMSLHVNADGDVELAVGGVPSHRRIITTRAEKLASLERERVRAAADARVNWNTTLDLDRAPAMTYTEARGCANIVLFASSADRGEVVTFQADARALALTTPQPRSFDLSKEPAFSLQIHVYERPVHADPCSDVGGPTVAESTWRAVSGSVEIELSPRKVDPGEAHRRRATVRVLGAEFAGPAGKRIRLSRPIVLTAIVGDVTG
jgi:hypothetical protein